MDASDCTCNSAENRVERERERERKRDTCITLRRYMRVWKRKKGVCSPYNSICIRVCASLQRDEFSSVHASSSLDDPADDQSWR